MKLNRLLCLTLGFTSFSVQSLAADHPTVYGLINKELRYLSQDDKANARPVAGATDVDGFETRLGAKGKFSTGKDTNVIYKLELGLNSSLDNSAKASSERLRMRIASIKAEGSFGSFLIGQDWQLSTLRMLALDPFTATGAQLLGYETGDMVGYRSGNIGMKARLFLDQLTYQTPEFSGLKYAITHDRASSTELGKATTTSVWWTHLFTYDREMGAGKLALHTTYAQEAKEDGSDAKLSENFINFGAKWSQGPISASLGFGTHHTGQNAASEDVDTTNMLAGFSYTKENCTYAFNFGQSDFGDKSDSTEARGKQSQMAVGMIHKYNDNFKSRFILRQTSRTSDSDIKSGYTGLKENTALGVIVGATVSF